MAKILLVSDRRTVLDEIASVVDEAPNEVFELRSGEAVRGFVADDPVDLVIADSQIENMGGIAVCHDLKLEASRGRIKPIPVLIVLDRRADVFLARRAKAEGFLIKPLDSLRIRVAVEALLSGGTYDDPSYRPVTAIAG